MSIILKGALQLKDTNDVDDSGARTPIGKIPWSTPVLKRGQLQYHNYLQYTLQ